MTYEINESTTARELKDMNRHATLFIEAAGDLMSEAQLTEMETMRDESAAALAKLD